MKENLTEIVYILDESGSMSSIAKDAIGGFNAFIEDQKKGDGEANLTVAFFDHEYKLLLEAKNIQEVKPITSADYQPRGTTALYDAVGRTVVELGNRLKNTPEDQRPSKVLFIIMTDGEENASHEYTSKMVQEMIEHQQKVYNWEFIFAGANQDSMLSAQSLGVNNWTTFSATLDDMGNARGVTSSYATMSKCVSSYRNTGDIGDLPEDIK